MSCNMLQTFFSCSGMKFFWSDFFFSISTLPQI
jgi:hypothetical protein